MPLTAFSTLPTTLRLPDVFISYAQNFEDVMLWRALKGVVNGHYIDVGAQDPISDSVSKAFYDLGWRGVHVEPVPQFAQSLREQRPDEQVFQVALGATAGTEKLYCIAGTGLSTVVEGVARRHTSEGAFVAEELSVPRLTLDMVFATLPASQIVHWLKIDVEGAESEVLKGWDKKKYRPWVVVVEATQPGSTLENFTDWELQLTSQGYVHVYSDGLNRFYLAEEQHAFLADKFRYPPNVFDGVSLSGLAHSPWTTAVETRSYEEARNLAATAESELANVLHQHEQLRHDHRAELQEAQQSAASALNDRDLLERELGQKVQNLQHTSLQWLQAHADQQKTYSEALSEHARLFQVSLQTVCMRAESLAEQAASSQRDVLRLTATVARLEVEQARESEKFVIRERDLLGVTERDAFEIKALTAETTRLRESVDLAERKEVDLARALNDSANEIARLSPAVADASTEVTRLQLTLTESTAAFEQQIAAERDKCDQLDQTIATLLRRVEQDEQCIAALLRRVEQGEQSSDVARQKVFSIDKELSSATRAVSYWESTAANYEWQVNALRASWSWRLTAPVRLLAAGAISCVTAARKVTEYSTSFVASIPKAPLMYGVRWIRSHPLQQRRMLSLLNRMPALRSRLLEFAAAVPFPPPAAHQMTNLDQPSALANSLERAPAAQPVVNAAITNSVQMPNPNWTDVETSAPPSDTSSGEFSKSLQLWQIGRRVNA